MPVKIIEHEPTEFAGRKTYSYDPDYRNKYRRVVNEAVRSGSKSRLIYCNKETFTCLTQVFWMELHDSSYQNRFTDGKKAEIYGFTLEVSDDLPDGAFWLVE